jgi:hypothetical protein
MRKVNLILNAIVYLVLGLVAWLLQPLLAFLTYFCVDKKEGYNRQSAFNLDVYSARQYKALWNKIFVKKDGYQIGVKVGESLSEGMGYNYVNETGTLFMEFWVWIVTPLHFTNAINYQPIKEKRINKIIRIFVWLLIPALLTLKLWK